MDPTPDHERLGDQPGFDAWADEVVATVNARRRAADRVAEREEQSAAPVHEARPLAPPKRRWRFLFS